VDLLAIYLNDHLAAATGGVELARRSRASNEGNEYGRELAELVNELEGERRQLVSLIDALGYRRDTVKVAGAWLAEKAGRLKLNGSLTSYSPLSRVVELEGLFAGVNAKLSMWENLRASGGAAGVEIDLDGLIAQAESQRARLTQLRQEAAAEAFAPR
jgi:hypothetical protein